MEKYSRKLWSSGEGTGLTIERSRVQILSNPMLDGSGVKLNHARLFAGTWLTS